MEIFITVIHVVVCLFLIVVVLLQAGKGAEIGAVMGGSGSQALFGGSGSGTFLSKLTVWAAALFMATNISITLLNRSHTSGSIMDSVPDPAPIEYNAAATGASDSVSGPTTETTAAVEGANK